MNKMPNNRLHTTLKKYSTIVFVWWWTWWHIQPIVSIIRMYKWSKKLFWIGGKNSNEKNTAKSIDIDFFEVSTLKLSTTKSLKILLYPFVLLWGIFQAIWILKNIKKNDTNICVFSKWWPWALAIGIAAWIAKIPLYIHESDTIPGRSNQVLSRFAEAVFLGFESAKQYFSCKNIYSVWQILDPVFFEKQKETQNPWKTDKPHLFVLCGSQWARSIFQEITEHLPSLAKKYEICIILGKLNTTMRKEFENKKIGANLLHIFDWMEQDTLTHWLSHTDLAITRGSATSLAELDVFGIKKIIIPLPSAAKNHQYSNAKEYEEKWDILLEQKDIHTLLDTLSQITPIEK